MTILFGDFETYSEIPIQNGTYAYAEKAEIMLFAYAFDEGPVKVWDLTDGSKMPAEVTEALEDKHIKLVFHNTMFDRTIMQRAVNAKALFRRAGADISRWHDTMVQALAHSLPGGLEKLCEVMGVDQDKRKHAKGKQLVQLFCKPRPKNVKLRRATRKTHPVEWQQFVDYAASDIHAMRDIYYKMPTWNYSGEELALWHLDQQINDRGFAVDQDLAEAAVAAAKKEKARLKKAGQEATDGQVESLTQRDVLLAHILEAYGVSLPDMQKATLQRRVEDPDLPQELRDLLALRLQASNASTAKYTSLMKAVNSDGRLRGTMQFNGAMRTGRWAHRRFQPGNMPRPAKHIKNAWEETAQAIKLDAVDLFHENVMEALGSMVRGCIVTAPDNKLVVSDLSNIEGRKAAWLAGENWKLKAFCDFDAGIGSDLYKVAYAKAFGIDPEDVDDGDQRQIGKVMELMLQYEGGVGAFLTGAATYGIDLDAMTEAAKPNIPSDVWQEAAEFYEWTVRQKRSTFDLPQETFLACDALKRLWRYAHPEISSYWKELKYTVTNAINYPGRSYTARRLVIRRDRAWLKIKLPSGRLLCYPSPQADDEGRISYMGINQYTRRWERIKTYGGKLFENITQASARDVMAYSMPAIEEAGYAVVLSVHDELVTETPDTDEYSVNELSELLATNQEWNEGLPLAAAGFEAYRYRKD